MWASLLWASLHAGELTGYRVTLRYVKNIPLGQSAIYTQYLWQAKHDKSGMSSKSRIEFQLSMCEIRKSLYEN